MNYSALFPESIRAALSNTPPGAWIPQIPTGTVRLSAGYPDPALVPTNELSGAVHRLLQLEGDLPLHYMGSQHAPSLRTWIAKSLHARHIHVSSKELLVTSGAFQAIDLVARVLLDDSKAVIVEAPTYMEALETFQNYTRDVLSVPVDSEGLCTDLLEELLAKRKASNQPKPCLLYTIPSFQNPTGVTLSQSRRTKLLSLAEMYDFLIIEDDAYGELFFDTAPQTLKSLDTAGRVIHIGSLSKVLAPGLRIGWAAAPAPIIHAMEWLKKDLDHPFVESVAAAYLQSVDWPARLKLVRETYRDRRDVMISALREHMPPDVTWLDPNGGYFVWLHLAGSDTGELLAKALEAGVSYIPGRYFFTNPEHGRAHLRLSFSHVSSEEMFAGVERLADVVKARR